MAGKFRGDVGKLKVKKNKSARKSKGKKIVSLVKRSRKLPEDVLQSRIAELTGPASSERVVAAAPVTQQSKKTVGKAAMEIVGSKRERIVPTVDVEQERTTAEAVGLKILHQAVKNQSHDRLLPHQNRHDYEYRLRSIATMGIVQLFNSLAQARKAGTDVETHDKHLTQDKTLEKKETVSKEAFLAALRQPTQRFSY
ncbi:hypothetical protein STCU_01273 [Strigomonas culicis]|uniref:Rrp15p n=2 Tax=Strigomonas culicis TaxID=28005 RepID=S9V210_9TRYP|nr:hypothetical protein STCU_01273 [Strigomonas culicis]|eukprot:EPY35054.1 hypothetical protein STCU_01273 [Strigomonas culicis]